MQLRNDSSFRAYHKKSSPEIVVSLHPLPFETYFPYHLLDSPQHFAFWIAFALYLLHAFLMPSVIIKRAAFSKIIQHRFGLDGAAFWVFSICYCIFINLISCSLLLFLLFFTGHLLADNRIACKYI